ncbi:hypothetical protein EDC01DRAFT_775558 [Geopyxis carbonaria]|nr:hypothetical protein EDC01DRAFT_775558 [Geopyxis carbonaria]
MSHYVECIQDMGSCDNTDTEAFEGAHNWMCKLAYRASNKVNYVVQMLAWEQRLFYIVSRLRHADLCLRMLINEPIHPKAIAATALIGTSHGRRLKTSSLTFHELSLDAADARWRKIQTVRPGTGLCCVSQSVNEDTGIRQGFARCTSSWRNTNKRYDYVMYLGTVGKAD